MNPPRVCEWHDDLNDCYYHGYMCRNRAAPKPSFFARIVFRVLWILGRRGKLGGL
jgi:hypothetical protein